MVHNAYKLKAFSVILKYENISEFVLLLWNCRCPFSLHFFKMSRMEGRQSCFCKMQINIEKQERFICIAQHESNISSFIQTITGWSPALSEITSCRDLLLGFELQMLPDLWSHDSLCQLWHALQKLQNPSPLTSAQPAPVGRSQYHLARIQAGWFVGGERCGVAV